MIKRRSAKSIELASLLSLKITVCCRREHCYWTTWRPSLGHEKWAQYHLQTKGTAVHILSREETVKLCSSSAKGTPSPFSVNTMKPWCANKICTYCTCTDMHLHRQEDLALWSHHKRDFHLGCIKILFLVAQTGVAAIFCVDAGKAKVFVQEQTQSPCLDPELLLWDKLVLPWRMT